MSDLIRKTDAIKALYEAWGRGWIESKCEWIAEACKQTLDALPTVEPERGEWIEFDTKWGRSLYYCTNCMETTEVPTAFGKPLYDFCPNCGADMREREGE